MPPYVLVLVLLAARVLAHATFSSSDDLWRRAMALYDHQQWTAAAALLEELTARQSNASVEAALATSYHMGERWDLARVHYERALAVRPDDANALANLGFLRSDTRQYSLAIPCFERAMVLDPSRTARLLHPLALAYHYQRDDLKADALYAQVPPAARTAQYHYDRAVTLERLGKILEAGHSYNDAILLDQEFANAWHNIAALHQKYGNVADSIPNYLRVLSITSTAPQLRLMAMTNLAIAYETTHDVRSALRWYERVRVAAIAQHEPLDTFVALRVHVARAKRTACVWDAFETEQDALQAGVRDEQLPQGRLPGLLPFDTLLVSMDPMLRLAIARLHSNEIATAAATMFATISSPHNISNTSKRLVVGYASYDYNDHPTAHLLEGVFVAHNRHAIDAIAYGYGRDDSSEFRQRLLASVDEFVNLAAVSTVESVRAMRARGLDILMDAQGHTRGSRVDLVAVRPAPVVVNYLVYPGTSGASYVDYLIVDRLVTPPDVMASHFSEKLVLLPASYQVNYYPSALVPHGRSSMWTEKEEEAEQEIFTFINFNKIDKLEPSVFSLWMAILKRVPQSRLLLLNPIKSFRQNTTTGEEIVQNLQREAAARGVDASRIAFVPRVTKREHLRRHRQGGLFLDTLVYGAHSTATDALYAGLPVLTLAGDAFASRVSVSLLHNVDLPELVTHSRKEFEDLAVLIATERKPLLSQLRQRLRTPDESLPRLFHTQDHVTSLEAAQHVMATLQRRATSILNATRPFPRTAHVLIV